MFGFEFSAEATEALIRSWGAWGVLGVIALMILHSFIPFPAEILAIATGMVYGTLWGSVITWVGAMIGAYLAFGLARLFGRPLVAHWVPKRTVALVDDWSRREGGVALLVLRLIPVIAFNLINYAAGLTVVSWWTFTWATGLGILPLTVLMNVMGASMTELPWWVWPLLVVLAGSFWLLLRRLRQRLLND